jgi:hypothetical protein
VTSSASPNEGQRIREHTVPDTLVARFVSLFRGYGKAYGSFKLAEQQGAEGEKVKGKAITVRGEPVPELYRDHLEGVGNGLGIIMLREDDTVLFGAIDLDVRDMNHAEWEQKVKAKKLPLVLCRSKSGGGHFYLFLKDPVPATVVRHRLTEYAALLGMAHTVEIFPKQSSRANDRDIGSWINLPWFTVATTNRYAIIDGKPSTFEQFLDAADAACLTPEQATEAVMSTVPDTLFKDGPPCLQTYEAQGGFPDGGKRNGMVSVGVYLQKAFPVDWEHLLHTYNERMGQLREDEVGDIVKSLTRKKYQYLCTQVPINAVCQKALCKKRLFGVGGDLPDSGHSTMEIEEITKYEAPFDDPLWVIVLNGKRVQLSNAELYSVDLFNQRCLAVCNIIPANVTGAKWRAYLQALVSRADVVPSPEDAGPWGQVWMWTRSFCTQNVYAANREGLQQGKVFIESDRVFFRSKDLVGYLKSRHVIFQNAHALWSFLRDRNAENGHWSFKGKSLSWWSLPVFTDAATAPIPAPAAKPDEEF